MNNYNLNIKLNNNLPKNCRSAKLIKYNGIDIGEFYKIKLLNNVNKLNEKSDYKVNVNQKYFIMGDINVDKNNNPINFTVFGSEYGYIKNIPWDYPCIIRVLGNFL
jgi:hypothetical protein